MKISAFTIYLGTVLMAVIPISSVQAASYAISYDAIAGFGLTFIGGTVNFSGTTFSADSAALNDLGTSGSSISSVDAPATCLNCAYNNSFTAHGIGVAPGYAYGDAQILNSNVVAGTGAASAISETGDFNDFANASGNNTLSGSFSIAGSSLMNINFMANPYMFTTTDTSSDSSAANVFMQITVQKKILQTFSTVFSWSPDGAAGGIIGGSETSDPFSLNYGISDNSIYNPGSGTFSASTLSLVAGNYKINIAMRNSVEAFAAQPPAAVPVPAALSLFGSGLLGLMGMARRKAA